LDRERKRLTITPAPVATHKNITADGEDLSPIPDFLLAKNHNDD
jgi:hypothetical protein